MKTLPDNASDFRDFNTRPTDPDQRATKVAQHFAWPLVAGAVITILVLLLSVLMHPNGNVHTGLKWIEWVMWTLFAFELVVRFALTSSRTRLVIDEWPSVAIVFLPLLQLTGATRQIDAYIITQAMRMTAFLIFVHRETRRFMASNRIHYAALTTGTVVVVSAALITDVERGHGGPIQSFSDGLWWAVETVTTVGYGDEVPHTTWGRVLATFLMMTGIALFLYLATSVAHRVLEREHEVVGEVEVEVTQIRELEIKMDAKLDLLLAKLTEMDDRLQDVDAGLNRPSAT